MSRPALSVDGLCMRYADREIFRDLSFTLDSGEVLAVTGENGIGKSTLLRILARLERPTNGCSTLIGENGRAVPDASYRNAVGYTAPSVRLYGMFTVEETLAMSGSLRGTRIPATVIAQECARVGLSDRRNDPVSALSTGLVQRLKLAVAVVHRPTLLLLDEPSSNLDEAGRRVVGQILEDHRSRGGVACLATNDTQDLAFCSRELWLRHP